MADDTLLTDRSDKPVHWTLIALIGGLGGMLPSISRLAATYVTEPNTEMPAVGLYFGLFLFFVVGAILTAGVRETEIRRALVLGIAAPGVITNIVAGVSDAQRDNSTDIAALALAAYAQEQPLPEQSEPEQPPSSFKGPTGHVKIETQFPTGGLAAQQQIEVFAIGPGESGTETAEYPVAQFPAGSDAMVAVPYGTEALRFSSEGLSNVVPLPDEPWSSATVGVELAAKPTNDFWWALGFRRQAELTGIMPTLKDYSMEQLPEPSFAPREPR